MDKGIYTALSGGIAKSHDIEIIANNLANATTPGFKRDTGTFNEYLTELRRSDSVDALGREIQSATALDGRPVGDKSFVEMDGIYTDYRQGGLQATNRPLDFGIEGQGFFEVLTPNGVRYTRQGNFSVAPDGKLVTMNGFPVLSKTDGSATANTVNPEGRVIQLGQGPIHVNEQGDVIQAGQVISRIGVVEFHENQWLEKAGHSYYRNVNDANYKPGTVVSKLHQGMVESSNVNPISEMTRLIEATRAYESHIQAVKTYQEVDSKLVNDLGRER